MTDEKLESRPANEAGELGDVDRIVVSSRVRLARNISGYPFPGWASEEVKEKVFKLVAEVFEFVLPGYFEVHRIDQMTQQQKDYLIEEHLISPEFARSGKGCGLILSTDRKISVMINEEDHLRIQCILPGFRLSECYEDALKLDQMLDEKLEFAFSEKLGYLTACPTNVGTAIRVSAMVHVPALVISGSISQVAENLGKLGVTVRGAFGEGTKGVGNMFQISNNTTLGKSEEEILDHLRSVVLNLADKEKSAREMLLKESRPKLVDNVARAFGILTHALSLSYEEAIELISMVRMGADLGIIRLKTEVDFNSLMAAIRPSHLASKADKALNEEEERQLRAAIVKRSLDEST